MSVLSDFDYPEFSLDEMSFMLGSECQGMATSLFFPENGKRVSSKARAACDRCDVQPECLAWALKNEEYGFWAGTTAEERAVMRKHAA